VNLTVKVHLRLLLFFFAYQKHGDFAYLSSFTPAISQLISFKVQSAYFLTVWAFITGFPYCLERLIDQSPSGRDGYREGYITWPGIFGLIIASSRLGELDGSKPPPSVNPC